MKNLLCSIAALFCLSLSSSEGLAEFGPDWANGGPYSKAGLAGKVVMLYFYEEG